MFGGSVHVDRAQLLKAVVGGAGATVITESAAMMEVVEVKINVRDCAASSSSQYQCHIFSPERYVPGSPRAAEHSITTPHARFRKV